MCIICRCEKAGEEFLSEFDQAMYYLKKAEKALLDCSKIDKAYDTRHKQLVKLRKELNRWNTEKREH